MAGLVAFLAVGVFILQLATTKKVEGVPQQAPTEEQPASTAPKMEALPQIEELEKRLKANPNDDTQLLQLANVLHDNHFYDRAVQRYKEYLRKHPNEVDARVDLGICYYESDRTSEAKQEMMKALQSNPSHVLGNFNLGIVNLRIAQAEMTSGNSEKANEAIKEANEWFRKTMALDPNGSAGQRAQRLLSEHGQSNKLPTN
jgi:tetratricopeptide (TPR) repeat protein